MSKEQPFKNPQELFEQFNQQTTEFMEGFATNQGQEMMKEFTKAWNSLATQSLQDPNSWMEAMGNYQKEQLKLWSSFATAFQQQGDKVEKVAQPAHGDRRFAGKEWNENPVFDYLKQSYLLASNMLSQMADNANLDDENQKKLAFYTRYFIDAMSPTNFAATNPEVLKLAMETKGQSLVDGLQNMLGDMEKGRISMTNEQAFELGKNIAASDGAVVFENEMFQLIQYSPTTEQVNERPIVIVPPCINKFYILDLQPENSYVKYSVDQGYTVFIISWKNPDKESGGLSWDDYIENGTLTAFNVAKDITKAKKINTVSWCVGGTILATTLAVMAKRKDQSVCSATFFTTMLDFSDPGELGVFIDKSQISQREAQLKHTGVLSGKDLALAFSMLRANDLIWSYVVNNYLKGKNPAPFDILYWNSDPTNLPATMYSYYLHNMYLENKLVEPDALTLCGEKINLADVKVPVYFLSTIDDHIAPWKTTFTGTNLFSGPIEFVLGASGHIAGVINPASKNKRNYWINGQAGKGADAWLDSAESQKGSWWPHWAAWLKKRGGNTVDAPKQLGNAEYKEIEAAPGRYVKERID